MSIITKTTPEIGFFQKLKAKFIRAKTYDKVALTEEIHLCGDEIRVPYANEAIQLILGKQRQGSCLWLCPEFLLNTSLTPSSIALIIFNPEHYFKQPSGFCRLVPGEAIVLGRSNHIQQSFFHFSRQIALKHLSIVYDNDAIIFKDLTVNSGTYISLLRENLEEEKIISQRMSRLARIRTIFGGPIQCLPPKEALATLNQVNQLLEHDPCRPLDDRGKPGGLVTPPEGMLPLIIGDLHSQVVNLIKILSENHFLDALEQGLIYLIFLGDAVHSEVDGEMENMESSMLIMDFIFKLKIRFPSQIFYLLGNHDSFSKNISKDGIPQGILWAYEMQKSRGKQYKDACDQLYLNLPYLLKSDQFVVCHAGPPIAKITKDMLVNIYKYPGLAKELIWNRLRRPGQYAGYTKMDVARLHKSLNLAQETPFIVAHNPLSVDASLWLNAGGIENHHIVFSGRTNQISIFFQIRDQLVPFVYTVEPDILTIINTM